MKNINSLKNTLQFKKVYSNGRSLANKYLVLYLLPYEGAFRLGISVSRKVGNSVTRHRITRLIRESYLAYKDIIPDGYMAVVVARTAAKGQSFDTIRSSFAHLLKLHGITGEDHAS